MAGTDTNKTARLVLTVDRRPISDFLKLIEVLSEFTQLSFDLSDLPFELVRFERDDRAASAGELRVVLYPSNALLGFVAAFFTGNTDLDVIE